MTPNNEELYASELDQKYPGFRENFAIPTLSSLGLVEESNEDAQKSCIYLCGNSLGLMPKSTEKAVQAEIDAWKARGVVSHFRHPTGEAWACIDDPIEPLLVPLVGAESQSEVAVMNTLTGNLHSMISTFYKPTKDRYKILCEDRAFPSDTYAFKGQVQLHGFDPKDAIVALKPRQGEYTLRTEDIIKAIEEEGDSIALVLFSGIQYYTGQLFAIPEITRAGHLKQCIVGWDLAHVVGNVPLQLHRWDVDFAVFCTYKYLNSGPGSIGGLFVHSKYARDNRPRLAGWWGNNPTNRFFMGSDFDPIPGAQGFRMSNPSVLNVVCLGEALKQFKIAGGMIRLRERSLSMTDYLYYLLERSKYYVSVSEASEYEGGDKPAFTIITPKNSNERGAQLSILFVKPQTMQLVFNFMESKGIITDERQPDVIRMSPNHFYNTHVEVFQAVRVFNEAMDSL